MRLALDFPVRPKRKYNQNFNFSLSLPLSNTTPQIIRYLLSTTEFRSLSCITELNIEPFKIKMIRCTTLKNSKLFGSASSTGISHAKLREVVAITLLILPSSHCYVTAHKLLSHNNSRFRQ